MQPYKKLYTFWFSVIIYDQTVIFCARWIKSFKLKEQMEGAARSGKQNIVEGSDGMSVSLKTGIYLSGVAKASIEELIGDLEDFLRQRGLKMWPKADARVWEIRKKSAIWVKFLSDLSNLGDENKTQQILRKIKLPPDQETAANFLLTLCHQATFLLNKQIESLKLKHQREGGLSEELYRKRREYRGY